MSLLRVHFLPELVDPAALAGSRCVIVDVLRATTTIVQALAAGANAVLPCLTIEDARRRASEFSAAEALLGGERGGKSIEGFALGNSPAEYVANRVAGKTIVLTTTNGTKALLHSAAGSEILIGAFVNLSAVCGRLQNSTHPVIDIICAGTDGHITREDVLFAGALADRLAQDGWQLDDQAEIARDAWHRVSGGTDGQDLRTRLVAAMRASRGGRNLINIGMAGDIALAAQVDRHGIVPNYSSQAERIQVSR
jgi:2-phosphosulfolactate phosphatase